MARAAGPATTSSYGSTVTESATGAAPADCIHAPHDVARGDRRLGLEQGSYGSTIAQEFQRLFQALEIVRADQAHRGSTVTSNDDALMLAVDPVDEFGEAIFHVS